MVSGGKIGEVVYPFPIWKSTVNTERYINKEIWSTHHFSLPLASW